MGRRPTILLLLFVAVNSYAQRIPENIFFEHIPVPGTIQSALTEDICQDQYGMMWVAKDALYRYNGKDFKKFEMIFNDSSLFSQREITKLFWDTTGKRLLIGTRNFGLVQYRYDADRLERLPSPDGKPIISDIVRTPEGVFVSSMTSGLYRVRNDTLFKHAMQVDARGLADMTLLGDDIWIGCLNEVIVVRGGETRRRIALSSLNTFTHGAVRASALLFDHKGRLWIGTERDGIAVIDTASLSVVKSFPPAVAPFYNSITRIIQDDDHLIWIATKGDGLIIYSPETDQLRQILSRNRTAGSITGEHCTSIFVDQSGIVWVGSSGDINKYDKEKIKFKHYNHDPYDPNSLSDENIRGIFLDDTGLIYVCTSGGFINTIDQKTNRIERIKPVIPGVTSFITPLCLAPYDKDNLFVGTSVGLLLYNKPKHSFKFFQPLEKQTRGGPVRQIVQHRNRYFMLQTGRVLRYTPRTGEAVIYDQTNNIVGASALVVDNQNRLWCGVRQGIAYSDPEQKEFNVITLTHDRDRPDSSFFLALSMQPVGNELWVNSFNNAIYIIDLVQDPPRLTERISTRNGLIDNTVYASIPDDIGNVWISHNSGLSQYVLQSHSLIHFSVSEGLQGEEFNRLAFYKTPSGEIILGGTNGINIFDPKKVNISKKQLNISLVDMTAYGARNNPNQSKYFPLVDRPQQVETPHDYNSFQFSYLVADFQDPARYKIKYRLEPYDNEWAETDKLTSGTYSGLVPGTYTFSVRVIPLVGDESLSRVSVVISPPYWRTWWFLGLTALVCSFLVYSIIYSRIQSTKRETRRLEQLLTARTREIEQQREELENLNRKKDLIFSILSHDLRSPLTTLKGFLGLLIDNSEFLTKEELQKYATNIRNSVTTSLDLIDNTLFWSLSQTGNIQCTPSTVPVGPMLEKIRDLYHLTAERKQITIHFLSVNGLRVHADENMLYVLLRNLVSNAIKFTPEKNSISVDAVQQGALVSIRVKDHGVGMSQHEVDNIFALDHPLVKKGTSSEKGTGLGLLLCKKFVELNHGKLLIESKEGEGSSFTVILPSA